MVSKPASTSGKGCTIIEKSSPVPTQPFALGVTVTRPIKSDVPVFAVVNELISPTPEPTSPIAELSLTQLYWFIVIFPVNGISIEDCSAQYSKSPIGSTIGVG